MHFMFLLPRSELEGSLPSLQLGYYDLINQINFFLLETSLGVVTEKSRSPASISFSAPLSLQKIC